MQSAGCLLFSQRLFKVHRVLLLHGENNSQLLGEVIQVQFFGLSYPLMYLAIASFSPSRSCFSIVTLSSIPWQEAYLPSERRRGSRSEQRGWLHAQAPPGRVDQFLLDALVHRPFSVPWCCVYCTIAVYSSPRSLFNKIINSFFVIFAISGLLVMKKK
jgi:hypothetical protein